jgi:hypothetical protein
MSKDEIDRENVRTDLGNTIPAAIRDIKQCSNDRPLARARGSLIEYYLKGDLRIHLQWTVKHRAVTEQTALSNYCIVLECPSSSLACIDDPARIDDRWERKLERLHKSARKMNRAVLVDVRQLIEVPKRATFVLPCRVRLEAFDKCCRLVTHPFQHNEAVSLKFARDVKNGELGSGIIRGMAVGRIDDKLKHKVIECRADIVDDLTNNNAPTRWTWFFHDHPDSEIHDAGSFCPSYSVELDGRFVRAPLKKNADFSLEKLDLLIGPLQFQADTVERRQHEPSR